MAFFRQLWTLIEKTLVIVFMRHWLGTLIRAFLAPIIFMFIISYTVSTIRHLVLGVANNCFRKTSSCRRRSLGLARRRRYGVLAMRWPVRVEDEISWRLSTMDSRVAISPE